MKLNVEIYIKAKWFPKPGGLKVLNQKFPPEMMDSEFYSRTFKDAPNSGEFSALIKHLEQLGMQPMSQARALKYADDPAKLKGHYERCYMHEYAAEDCARCELVRFWPEPNFFATAESRDGVFSIDVDDMWNVEGRDRCLSYLSGSIQSFTNGKHNELIVSDKLRRHMERAKLTGWRANRVEPTGDYADYAQEAQGTYWQVEAVAELRYSNQMRWEGADGEIHGSGEYGVMMPEDGSHVFDRAAWEQLGKPDFTVNRRDRGGGDWDYVYIASQRFMKFWLKHGLEARWEPVRLV